MKDAEKAGEAATKEKLTAFARETGYEISIDEMKSFFTELFEKEKGQLSDAELDMVAGGKSKEGTIVLVAGSVVLVVIGCIAASVLGEVYHLIENERASCQETFS